MEKSRDPGKAALLIELLKKEKNFGFHYQMVSGIACTSSTYFNYFTGQYSRATKTDDKLTILAGIGKYPDRRAADYLKNVLLKEKDEKLLTAAMAHLGVLAFYKMSPDRYVTQKNKDVTTRVMSAGPGNFTYAPPEKGLELNGRDCQDLEKLFLDMFFSSSPQVQKDLMWVLDGYTTNGTYNALIRLSKSDDEEIAKEAKRIVDRINSVLVPQS